MRIPRIYLDSELSSDNTTELTPHAFQHTVKVLRMKQGAALIVFDGKGNEFNAELDGINKKSASINIKDKINNNNESPLKIHLALGISKGDRMDYAIQKAVELGVAEITPLLTERCVVNLDEKRLHKKHQHWQGVIISACEQCGRAVLPKLNNAVKLTAWSELRKELSLVLDPTASKNLKQISLNENKVNLVIGPEGGLSESEVSELSAKEFFHPVQFGSRILRTETAAVATITAMQFLWGDLT